MNQTLDSRRYDTRDFIVNNSQALYNNYTKTQAYMQCGSMSVKNNTRMLRSVEAKLYKFILMMPKTQVKNQESKQVLRIKKLFNQESSE